MSKNETVDSCLFRSFHLSSQRVLRFVAYAFTLMITKNHSTKLVEVVVPFLICLFIATHLRPRNALKMISPTMEF